MTINQSWQEIGNLSESEKVWKNTKHVNIELGTLRKERDVQMILKCLKNWTPNIWHSDQPISNIATGKTVREAMRENTLSLKEWGHQAMSEIIERFTLSEDTTTGKSYYAPIKRTDSKPV